jgi:predicted ATPase
MWITPNVPHFDHGTDLQLRSNRQELQGYIAQVLEQRFPEVVTQPELLAHHSAEGGLAERAVDYWFAAGERALRTSAQSQQAHRSSRSSRASLQRVHRRL